MENVTKKKTLEEELALLASQPVAAQSTAPGPIQILEAAKPTGEEPGFLDMVNKYVKGAGEAISGIMPKNAQAAEAPVTQAAPKEEKGTFENLLSNEAFADALIGAIPGAVGALFGGQFGAGAGFAKGSELIGERRQQRQQEAQAQAQADRQLALQRQKSEADLELMPLKTQYQAVQNAFANGLMNEARYKQLEAQLATDIAKKQAEIEARALEGGKEREAKIEDREDKQAFEAEQKALDRESKKSLLSKAKALQSPGQKLLPEVQKAVSDLASKTANIVSISDSIDSSLEILKDPAISQDQKLAAGRQMIKTLNSTQGQDAVGAEEARRLAGYLEFRIGNLTEPGKFIGRDLDGFTDQATLISNMLKNAAQMNISNAERMREQNALFAPKPMGKPSDIVSSKALTKEAQKERAAQPVGIKPEWVKEYATMKKIPEEQARKELEAAQKGGPK